MLRIGRSGRQRRLAANELVRASAILLLVLSACSPPPDALYRRSETLLREGSIQDARAAAERGLAAEKSWRFRLLKAKILLSLKPREALEVLSSADPPSSGELRSRLEMYRGVAQFYLGDFRGAQASLGQAQEIAAPLRLGLLDSEIEIDRGMLAGQQGETDNARECFLSALRLATDHGGADLEARAMLSLGVLLQLTHHPDEAIYWLEKGRDVAARAGATSLLANALGNLGSSYFRLGDYDRARDSLDQAEKLFAKMGNRQQQQIWIGNSGNVSYQTGDLRGAVEKYKQAYAMAQSVGDRNWAGWWVNNLARTSIDLGDFDAAEGYNQEALRLKRDLPDRSDFYPRVNEATIAASRKDYPAAEKLYREILAEPSDDPVPTLDAEAGLSAVLARSGQNERADAQFRAGIDLVERRSAGLIGDQYKLSYLSSLIDFYQRYVDFLVERGETERAAEVADSSRARLLDERLNSPSPKPSPRPAGLRDLARSSDAVLLSYWLAPKRSFLWAITSTGVTLHILPPEKEIAALVENYRSFIEGLRDPLQTEFPAGRKLSEILLGPVRGLLGGNVRIVIVADGALNSLNFETLPDPGDASKYMIERATIAMAPSLAILGQRRPKRSGPRTLLLIGDPEPAAEEYPKLPYAGHEMDLIARDFPADRCRRIEGADAVPAAYRESSPGRFAWIHFAAHAAANRENPLDSALILSGNGANYMLSAREVMKIPLDADLVTLSACRSAGARTFSGEGLVGLSWAFLRAGARRVVAGLWGVTDQSTASLMGDFYGRLTRSSSPAEALRQAKLDLIHGGGAYRKPFYWGPFQLYTGTGF